MRGCMANLVHFSKCSDKIITTIPIFPASSSGFHLLYTPPEPILIYLLVPLPCLALSLLCHCSPVSSIITLLFVLLFPLIYATYAPAEQLSPMYSSSESQTLSSNFNLFPSAHMLLNISSHFLFSSAMHHLQYYTETKPFVSVIFASPELWNGKMVGITSSIGGRDLCFLVFVSWDHFNFV